MSIRVIEIDRRRWNPPKYTWHVCWFTEEVPNRDSLNRESRNRLREALKLNFKGKMLLLNLILGFFPETDECVSPAANPVNRESTRLISGAKLEPEHVLVELRRAFEIRNVEMRFEHAFHKRRWQIAVGHHLNELLALRTAVGQVRDARG
jgi:hypothetical protein